MRNSIRKIRKTTKPRLYAVPFTEIATDLGTSLMKNMVAMGATCALLNLEMNVFQNVVKDIFGRKGQASRCEKYGSNPAGREYCRIN